jgi:hypothetical protein
VKCGDDVSTAARLSINEICDVAENEKKKMVQTVKKWKRERQLLHQERPLLAFWLSEATCIH